MQQSWGRVKLTEVNPHLVCVLCHGYFIDATTMAECPHSFCRSCIILYLETKSYCPICEVQIHKTKPHLNLKPDKTLQDIVYKLVPGLFHSEMRRRREFYTKHPNHDLYLNPEARGVGVERIIYSPEDSISLSLEYYDDEKEREEWTSAQPGVRTIEKKDSSGLKRYLQCPAVVTMSHIKKFIRLKYNLAPSSTVEVLYRRESLPDSYSLMDVAYIYTWKRNGPMQFYYRIHVPLPVRQSLPALSLEPTKVECETKVDNPCSDEKAKIKETVPDSEISAMGTMASRGSLECINGLSKETQKDETRTPVSRPYASEHDELSVDLLLSLSNGYHRESVSSRNETDTENESKQSNSSKCETTEISKEIDVRRSSTQGSRLENVVAGPKDQSSETKAIKPVDAPAKAVARKTLNKFMAKPPVNTNNNIKSNGQMVKHILANKLLENKNASFTKSVQNIPTNLNVSKEQSKLSLEPKKINEESKTISSGQVSCPSPKPISSTEKVQKSSKYMPPLFVKNPAKNNDSIQIYVDRQQQETNSEKTAANNCVSGNKTLPNSDQCVKTAANNYCLSGNKTLPNSDLCVKTAANNCLSGNKTLPNQCVKNGANNCVSGNQTLSNSDLEARDSDTTNVVPPIHRKEVNRLEQIVKNCIKKSNCQSNKPSESHINNNDESSKTDPKEQKLVKPSPLSPRSESVEEADKEETSILKRKLKDPSCFVSVKRDKPNIHCPSDPKKRKLVTPDVSIELTTHPAHENKTNPLKRPAECSDLSILTKRFLNSLQQMKKHTPVSQSVNVKDIDQLCASNVKIEKVPASHISTVSNKIEPHKHNIKHKKKDDLVSIAIERINENIRISEKCNGVEKHLTSPEPVPSTSAGKATPTSPSLKKLPRLIEINAPPRPKLQPSVQDPKLRTGLKMTTIRKEVPIGKEGPLVRKDNSGALDLSSGSPGSPKNKPATVSSPRPAPTTVSPSSLSPLQALSSFSLPDMKTSPTLRIPNLKHKTSPHLQPRPSSLSSSSPSPPADSRTSEIFTNSALQQLYRHQLEFQNRLMASSQINNNKWRQDPLSTKKFEEWMRNMVNCGGLPPHPLMFPSETTRK